LTIALTKTPGSFVFEEIYALDLSPYRLSYPYAIERDGILYVAYSQGARGNENSAVILQIPIEAL
jgi:hypothetical protein